MKFLETVTGEVKCNLNKSILFKQVINNVIKTLVEDKKPDKDVIINVTNSACLEVKKKDGGTIEYVR